MPVTPQSAARFEGLTASQLDQEPVAFFECSISEFKVILFMAPPVCMLLGALLGALVGALVPWGRLGWYVTGGVCVGIISMAGAIPGAAKLLSYVKRGKPRGCYMQALRRSRLWRRLGWCPYFTCSRSLKATRYTRRRFRFR